MAPSASTAPPRRRGRPRQDDPRAAEVRERLLDAATELTVAHGFDVLGLRDIAGRAGVSPGMIAYYFGDRSGLYDAMFERALARVTAKVSAQLEGDGARALEDLMRILVDTLAEDPLLPQLVLRELLAASANPTRRKLAERIGGGPLPRMVRWLEDEQARGALRADLDPKLLALTLAGLASFPYLFLPRVGDTIGVALDASLPARLIAHNLEILSHGIRARPEKSP